MAINWPGLLAWSTKYHDGTAPSQFKQMSDEDRKFLEKAMEEAFGKIEDPNEVLVQAIGQITSAERTDESISTSLEVIDRLCDDPDVARNVEKLNGMQPLLDLLSTHDGAIRARTLEILALLLSNNPTIQKVAMERGAMKAFLQLARDSPRCSEDRSKGFRALVSLVRQVKEFEELLLRGAGGLGLLVELLSPEEEARTREKAASFVRSLACDGCLRPEEAGALASTLAGLLPGLQGEGISYRETVVSSILEIARAFPGMCPPQLCTAAQTRLAQLRAASDPDAEQEAQLHEDLIAALTGGGATATAAAAPAA